MVRVARDPWNSRRGSNQRWNPDVERVHVRMVVPAAVFWVHARCLPLTALVFSSRYRLQEAEPHPQLHASSAATLKNQPHQKHEHRWCTPSFFMQGFCLVHSASTAFLPVTFLCVVFAGNRILVIKEIQFQFQHAKEPATSIGMAASVLKNFVEPLSAQNHKARQQMTRGVR